MEWVLGITATVQAVATVVLVCITRTYVRHTKKLVTQPGQQVKDERNYRQRAARDGLYYEWLEIIRICEQGLKRPWPAPLPTYIWDTMRVDLRNLKVLTDLTAAYASIRYWNALQALYIATGEENTRNEIATEWTRQIKANDSKLRSLAAQIRESDSTDPQNGSDA